MSARDVMPGVITDPAKLEAGKWYACGFQTFDTDAPGVVIDWGGAAIYRYDGEGCWSDESGEEVTSLFDPFLQARVAMHAADAYMVQS